MTAALPRHPGQSAANRMDPRDQTIADLRAKVARLERSNAELAKANGVLRDMLVQSDEVTIFGERVGNIEGDL